ncbi:MAG: hypothetical protein J7M05_00335 [Anaerolineae bacterium]|nr:hypothetical protein [Anaerolineae bacterium]
MLKLHPSWPVLTHYEGRYLNRIAMPLGGIGTGTVSLGGRGNLQDWEMMNRPAKGFWGGEAFFTLYARVQGQAPIARVLEGALPPPYEGHAGIAIPHHGLPRFRHCSFHVAYPLAQVLLSDPEVPLQVRLEAFNPLIPAEPTASGIPIAVLRYVLNNELDTPVQAAICASLKNFIGYDGLRGQSRFNVNTFRAKGELKGLFFSSEGVPPEAEQFGTIALATTMPEVTYQLSWRPERWNGALLNFWDDFTTDGRLEKQPFYPQDTPVGSLAAETIVPPKGMAEITFLLTWHFPNRLSWTPFEGQQPAVIGNYYTTLYTDAWDVALRVLPQLGELEEKTVRFVHAFCSSDLPQVVKEAALYNLSTLRSQTCFRTKEGFFFGWEGCRDHQGCCHGSCTHVWNYEQATAFLFGDLARLMREVEFLHATDERGLMSFRVNLPLEHATDFGLAAADGQMGCIMKVYRDWRLCGDDEWLRRLWPQVKKALSFAWIKGGWDADQDGVMEGCQHNTLDVEYYGPNPLMGTWYLGALRAAEEMARYLGDTKWAQKCRELYERGSAWVDAHLFNGEYYEQQVRPIPKGTPIAQGLRHPMGTRDPASPDYQVGRGCLVDQLAGQFMAHVCALGHLLSPEHMRKALANIFRYNFQHNLYGHFNPMRTFALNDEQGLLICTYPKGERPRRPVPYFTEIMTGFEYTASIHMLYEGLIKEGLQCISAIRARYDGYKRNPFDEAECGHHYARAMASWAAVLALSGFDYSAPEKTIAFTSTPGRYFWSTGYAWGTCTIITSPQGSQLTLQVLHGTLQVRQIKIKGHQPFRLETLARIKEGSYITISVPKVDKTPGEVQGPRINQR